MAVSVNIVKGDPARFDEYVSIFDDSSLYEHYFKGTDTLAEWVKPQLDKGQVWIAETLDGEPVGLMVMTMDGMFAELPYLALLGVKKGYRSKGIGELLINFFFGVAKGMGFNKAFIATSDFNVRAKQLYQRLGFKKILIVPDLLKKGIAEQLFMIEFK